MLSRFSVLSVYLVAALAASAVATPAGQSGGYGDDMKQPSRHNSDQEHSYPPKYYSARDSKGQYKNAKDGEYKHSKKHDPWKGQCNVEKQQCCNSVNQASENGGLLALLGLGSLAQATSLMGTNCSPGAGTGGSCEANPVCCENTKFEGLFAFGCSNINVDVA